MRLNRQFDAEVLTEYPARLESLKDDEAGLKSFAIDFLSRMCEELLAQGAPGLHFYTLNRSPATREIQRPSRPAVPTVAVSAPKPQVATQGAVSH